MITSRYLIFDNIYARFMTVFRARTTSTRFTRVDYRYPLLYFTFFISLLAYLYPPQNLPTMAWLSSGSSNAALINNLRSHGLVKSDRVAQAMLGVC